MVFWFLCLTRFSRVSDAFLDGRTSCFVDVSSGLLLGEILSDCCFEDWEPEFVHGLFVRGVEELEQGCGVLVVDRFDERGPVGA